ncbi:TetR/AcrR family transcriptional regulator [Flaviaesturariibacter aridisoli]|uniref:TetR/AcrR family transcriptional regulator n=1 Tax=Flaviaesturariibacter aridisoli TaxID=2545761 RepID=A0A4R4E6Q4_9BACT|nr:TetR/AcrR family transcriptional regulator [Flaviaesturariibacter aridisoli]TCZ73375.1 TetR/AcrR family transcriptional regulator [Flaviaesturariibacter aridisoli]
MATDQKRESILEAAIRRFAHFGVAKTTMNEIAADLSISKALLYYYFPDKMSLYAAVLEHISELDRARHDSELEQERDPMRALERYLDIRTDFILKYYQVLEHLKAFSPATLPEPLLRIFDKLRRNELDRISAIMEKGRAAGLFKIDHARKSAELYFDFLDGFRVAQLSAQPNIFPEKKQFSAILRREKEFSRIFLNGLTCDR